jgi:thioester reductase-like protein
MRLVAQAHPIRTPKSGGLVVLLTGATGALGAHFLDVSRSRPDVERIYCLLRASGRFVASKRVNKALKSKAKEGLRPIGKVEEKVVCLPCNLAQADLGLEKGALTAITSTMDVILHTAWAVNFTLGLKSFDFHLAGVQNLLNLGFAAARTSNGSYQDGGTRKRLVRFASCSSIASVSASSGDSIAELISENPSDASPLGYSRSKWVAELSCANAHIAAKEACAALDIDILRIGQLCVDTDLGIWNMPLMLSTYDVTGCLPDPPGVNLDWLPLDIAANAVCEIVCDNSKDQDPTNRARLFHVLNSYSTPNWAQILQWLRNKEGGRMQTVEPAAWLEKLEQRVANDQPGHPSRKLLGLWKEAYLSRGGSLGGKPGFAVRMAAKASESLRSVQPVSQELIQ